jgi:hypothetical protein
MAVSIRTPSAPIPPARMIFELGERGCKTAGGTDLGSLRPQAVLKEVHQNGS